MIGPYQLKMGTLTASLLIAAALGACQPAAAEENTQPVFRFAPANGTTWTEESTSRRTLLAAGLDPDEETLKVRIRYSVTRSDAGYTVVADPSGFEMTRAGKPVADPVQQVVNTTRVTYRLDAEGRLQSIEGYGSVLDAALRVAPKEMARSLPATLGEKVLQEKETSAWRARIGDAIGLPAETGTGWVSEGVTPLPDGRQARYYIVTVFTGWQQQGDRKLARLKFTFGTDSGKLQAQANDLARDTVRLRLRPRPVAELPGFSISGSGERLVDPETMIVHSEKSSRTIQIPLRGPKGQEMPVVLQETRETRLVAGPSAEQK
ncbi:MAG: hypothetical protein ACUVSM_10120 [Armatimonadota bacterium]